MDRKSPMKIFETEVDFILTENARKMLKEAAEKDADQYRKGFEDGKKAGPDWIPITTEKITQKEKEELAKKYDVSPEDFDDCWRYTCPLPEDGQKVLVTTSVWGYIAITEFNIDEEGAGFFEDYEDETDITAWMPLPAPYTTDHQEESDGE